jgi:hypothetical protein
MILHLIADDLEQHDWYDRLVRGMVAEVEALLARWAEFERRVETLESAED